MNLPVFDKGCSELVASVEPSIENVLHYLGLASADNM